MNMKKILGVYAMVLGMALAYGAHKQNIMESIHLVDLRMDEVRTSFRDVQDNIESSVVVLTNRFSGSGFYIDPHYVVTNAHVVRGSTIVLISNLDLPSTARVIAANKEKDVALLWVKKVGVPVLTYNTHVPKVGDFIYSVGTNDTNLKSIKTGYITSYNNDIVTQAFTADSRLEPGFSGGATFDRYNVLIGINVAIGYNYKEKYSFIIKYSEVKEWLMKNMIIDKAYRQAQGVR